VDPTHLLEKLKSLGGSLTMAQRLSLAGAFLGVILVVGGSTYWMQRPDYVLLFADMNAEAASDVITRLKSDKVPYQLDDGGRAIRVPASRVDELRLGFASEGLPSSGRIGFEIFDRTAFGATEFLEQVNYRRALEGEIARSISTISEVSGARVHIAMAKQSLFASKEQPAKASVVLKLKGNRPLSAATIQGITNLVASSVEGLRPDAVVVLDSFGRPLARPAIDGDEPLGAAQMERQQQIERDLTNKVIALLEPVVGQEGVRVNVSARLDASSEESTEEKWDPNTRAIRSRQVSGDVAAIAKAQGIAGTRANLPGAMPAGDPAAAAATAAATSAAVVDPPPQDEEPIAGRGSETTNFEISRMTRHTVRPRGTLARLSIAVILDNEAVVTKTPEGAVSRTMKPRSPESLQKIQALVAAAVGLDPARGDQLTVDNVPFEEPVTEEPAPVSTWQRIAPQAYEGARFAVPLILGLVALLFVIRPMLRGATASASPLPIVSEVKPRTVQDLEGEIEAQLDAALAEKSSESRKLPVLSRRLATLTTKEPEHAARLLRMWMTEEGGGAK
jgi:flagellar M-ring protein FliF